MRVGTHLWHDDLKGQFLLPTMCRENHRQSVLKVCYVLNQYSTRKDIHYQATYAAD